MQFLFILLWFLISLLHFQLSVLANVRGIPGVDYPNYSSIPKTSFQCPEENTSPGFYADFETRCQVFHHCFEYRKESFLCPEGTTFNDAIKSCDYWYSSECDPSKSPYKIEIRKPKKNTYNDVPLVPVKVQTNNIFDKMVALYEPKENLQGSLYKGQGIEESFEDNRNENFDTDSYRAEDSLLIKSRDSSDFKENMRDFVKYQHDSDGKDDVDIIFHDSSVNPSQHKNKNENVNNIGFLSKTEADRYQHQDSPHTSPDQTDTAFQPQDHINFPDQETSDSLVKRLSDGSDSTRKRKFRRKPTYVVLQTTQELGESPAESAGYGVEENLPLKNVNVHKTNAFQSLQSDTTHAKTNLEEDFNQVPVRKLRRNRKPFGVLTDETDNINLETIELVKVSQSSIDEYDDKPIVYQSSHAQSIFTDTAKTGSKSEENIQISIQKPRRNRKTFGVFNEEPDKVNGEMTRLVDENQVSYDINIDKTNEYHSLLTESAILDSKESEAKLTIPAKKPNRSRKSFGILIDEPGKASNKATESDKPHQDSFMPVNIMSPSFETDEEPIIFVKEHDKSASTTDTFVSTRLLTTKTAPNLITENESEEKDVAIENSVGKEESHFNFHQLKNSDTDVMTEQPATDETEPADDLHVNLKNNQNFIPPVLNINTEFADQPYLEQEINHGIVNMNSEMEDMEYSEQEINLGNINSEIEELEYLEQEMYDDDIANMNSELADVSYSEQDTNPDTIDTRVFSNLGILSTDEQADQHDKQNKYDTMSNTFSGGHIDSIFLQPIKEDYSNNNYDVISTLSPVSIADSSPIRHVFDGDVDEKILMNENLKSFEDEQTRGIGHDLMHYTDNVHEINSEHEEGTVYSDMDTDISDLFEESETKYFSNSQGDDFTTKYSQDHSKSIFGSEKNALQGVPSAFVKNIEPSSLKESDGLHAYDSFPSQIRGTYSNKNAPFSKTPKKSSGSSTFVEDSKNWYADETGSVIVSEESFEKLAATEDSKDIHIDKNEPYAKTSDLDSEEELAHIHAFENDGKIQNENFEEQNKQFAPTKTSKSTLLITMQHEEFKDFDDSNVDAIKNEEENFDETVYEHFDENPKNTNKATFFQPGFVKAPPIDEETNIESVFHSSSMPLPANMFEQGLYQQSLREEKNVPKNKGKTYPVTFYKELDESFEKAKAEKSAGGNNPNNKKYRSLSSGFSFDERIPDNGVDESPNYREPSLLSLLAPAQTAKNLLSLAFPGLKSGGIFSPPVSRAAKPNKLKKLVTFGKNLLAFKRAKMNDFRSMFDSFLEDI